MIFPDTPQTAAAVAAHYDDLDEFYREVWGQHVHHGLFRTGTESVAEATEALITHLAGELGLAAGQRLVDIGCGYGGTAEFLAARHAVHVTGLTLSQAQLAGAGRRRPAAGSVAFRQEDWLANTLVAASFDRAYAVESSEHMTDKAAFFAQAARVLKPGAIFGIYAWLSAERPSRWEVRHLLEPICGEGRLPSMGTLTEYHRMAHAAGLVTVTDEDLSAQVARTWTLCAERVARNLVTKAKYRRFLLDPRQQNRIFAATLVRLIVAYRTRAMRYCLLVYRKPE